MLKIYSDRKFLSPHKSHVVMLAPFWGKVPEDPSHPKRGRFDRFFQVGSRFFSMTSLEDADVVVYPQEWESGQRDPGELGWLAKSHGKSLIIFFNHDSDEEIPVDNAVIFRTSFYRSRRRSNEHALPAWSEDLVERFCGGELLMRPKRPRPVVSYCGYTNPQRGNPLKNFIRCLLKGTQSVHPGQRIRGKAVGLLRRNSHIETNFLIRRHYWGGAFGPKGLDHERALHVRKEFVANMISGDYVLCARGGGNFSYRLYETLSCGRIPLFVDTDCVLPYDDVIDWKQYCVWIPEDDLDRIAEILLDFHSSLSDDDFKQLQIECRRLWLEWISPEGFFKNFHRFFQNGA